MATRVLLRCVIGNSDGELLAQITGETFAVKEREGARGLAAACVFAQFPNVLDEKGACIIGQEISVDWPGEKLVILTENKPLPEYSANFPLDVNHYPPWGTLGAFDVRVNGLPSDKVIGMGLPPKNRFVVYLLTFQRTIGEH